MYQVNMSLWKNIKDTLRIVKTANGFEVRTLQPDNDLWFIDWVTVARCTTFDKAMLNVEMLGV